MWVVHVVQVLCPAQRRARDECGAWDERSWRSVRATCARVWHRGAWEERWGGGGLGVSG